MFRGFFIVPVTLAEYDIISVILITPNIFVSRPTTIPTHAAYHSYYIPFTYLFLYISYLSL